MIDCAEDFNNGQNDVIDGSVENYDFNWNEAEEPPEEVPEDRISEQAALDEPAGLEDNKSK